MQVVREVDNGIVLGVVLLAADAVRGLLRFVEERGNSR